MSDEPTKDSQRLGEVEKEVVTIAQIVKELVKSVDVLVHRVNSGSKAPYSNMMMFAGLIITLMTILGALWSRPMEQQIVHQREQQTQFAFEMREIVKREREDAAGDAKVLATQSESFREVETQFELVEAKITALEKLTEQRFAMNNEIQANLHSQQDRRILVLESYHKDTWRDSHGKP